MSRRVPGAITIVLALPLLFGGCGPTKPAQAVEVGSIPNSAGGGVPGFPTREAETVFRRAYETIEGRFLDPIHIGDVAVEGLRGMSGIDRGVAVLRDGDKVAVTVSGQPAATLTAPDGDDIAGWVRVTMQATEAARENSAAMAAADAEKVYSAVLEAALAHIDNFSRYASAAQARDNRAARNGFGGVGIRYEPSPAGLAVTAVQPDSPASKARVAVGDVITHIEGQATAGMEAHAVTERLRGAVDSSFKVSLRKVGQTEPVEATLIRTLIVPETVKLTLDRDLAVIRVSSFNQRTAVSVGDALRESRAKLGSRLKGVVLDLRGNPGGLLDQGVTVSDLFLPRGAIVSTRGRHPDSNQKYTASAGDIGESMPVAVLVDGRSASASEIVAAALQDNNRAVVIGTTSYGKGTVQTVVHLPNDGEMTLTWSRFHSPSGYALHGLGVLPSVCTKDLSADPQVLADALRSGDGGAPQPVRVQWRTTAVGDTTARKTLREACPASRHEDAALDVEVARRVLTDNALYARAISLFPQVAAQH